MYQEIRLKKSGDIPQVSWSDGSIDDISKMIEAHYKGEIDLSTIWNVGDTRLLEMPSIPTGGNVGETQPTQVVQLAILGFNHDDLSDGSGKSALTVQVKNCLSTAGYIHNSQTSATHWVGCSRRLWCNGSFYNSIPTNLRLLIKQVKKEYNTSDSLTKATAKGTCDDYVFLLSGFEVHGEIICQGTNFSGTNSYINTQTGNQYQYFKTNANVSKGIKWLVRDKCNNTGKQYCLIATTKKSGYTGSKTGYVDLTWANSTAGIAPAFCL